MGGVAGGAPRAQPQWLDLPIVRPAVARSSCHAVRPQQQCPRRPVMRHTPREAVAPAALTAQGPRLTQARAGAPVTMSAVRKSVSTSESRLYLSHVIRGVTPPETPDATKDGPNAALRLNVFWFETFTHRMQVSSRLPQNAGLHLQAKVPKGTSGTPKSLRRRYESTRAPATPVPRRPGSRRDKRASLNRPFL